MRAPSLKASVRASRAQTTRQEQGQDGRREASRSAKPLGLGQMVLSARALGKQGHPQTPQQRPGTQTSSWRYSTVNCPNCVSRSAKQISPLPSRIRFWKGPIYHDEQFRRHQFFESFLLRRLDETVGRRLRGPRGNLPTKHHCGLQISRALAGSNLGTFGHISLPPGRLFGASPRELRGARVFRSGTLLALASRISISFEIESDRT